MSDNHKDAVQTETSRDAAARVRNSDFVLPDDTDPELLDAFIREGRDLISIAEKTLLAWETEPDHRALADTLFRIFHNIRGTSSFFEISIMADLARHAESFSGRLRSRNIPVTSEHAALLTRSVAMFGELFGSLGGIMRGEPFVRPESYDELSRLLARSGKDERSGTSDPEAISVSENQRKDIGEIPPASNSGHPSPSTHKAPPHTPDKRDEPPDAWETPPQEDGKAGGGPCPSQEESMDAEEESLPEASRSVREQRPKDRAESFVESSVRVSVDRLDRFIDMVGELVVSHSMLSEDGIVAEAGHHELAKKIAGTGKIVRELQQMSMSMRMVPLRTIFRKMARLVRDMARKLNKKIVFETRGEDTEIDRNMVEMINDPLVHIIRNAADHGIEPPEVRMGKGKPPHGSVRLSAIHVSGNVVIEVRDDGKGFDRTAILRKASERGLIRDAADINDQELLNLIFRPGFSTLPSVSEISGRGVGMDVVKKNIEALHGQVTVSSVPGEGSTFGIRLPLTLAIIDGMVVRVGAERYVMPIMSIVRSVRPDPRAISTVSGKAEMLSLQGRLIPLFRVGELFGISDAERDPARAIVVVVEDNGRQAGLVVDELIGNQQIVIKTMGEIVRNIPGISGSAIMPDGRVGLILDIGGLVGIANG